MLQWNSLHFDEDRGRWFESTGGGFCDWRDADALQEADDAEIMDFHMAHPEINVRESFWQITWGEDDSTASFVLVVLSEYEEGECSFSFSLADLSLQELEMLEEAVHDWHGTGQLKLGRFCCSPCCDF